MNGILPFWQDAMVVMLKSLMPGCFFNVVGFGSTYKSLFPTSQNYDEVKTPLPLVTALSKRSENCTSIQEVCASLPSDQEALTLACEYVRKVRADMGGTNILDPLSWILRQPMIRGHPRLLFLLTDGAVSNTGRVIELVRGHARYIRRVGGALPETTTLTSNCQLIMEINVTSNGNRS